jgi:hypothetical protein
MKPAGKLGGQSNFRELAPSHVIGKTPTNLKSANAFTISGVAISRPRSSDLPSRQPDQGSLNRPGILLFFVTANIIVSL